jgi:hypothetical protein
MELIIDKLKKIKELSERGINGEAKAAKAALEKLLAKYSLTVESLSSETKIIYCFKAKEGNDRAALFMCVLKVAGNEGIKTMYRIKGEKANNIYVDLTEYEFAEVSQLYDFHKHNINKEFEKTINSFQQAYQYRHRLYASDKTEDGREMTGEEIMRILKYASDMDDVQFYKEIEQ